MNEEQRRFLTELRDLLERYDAEIVIDCDDPSDLHGVTGECTGVSIGHDDRFHDLMTIELGPGWGVTSEDLTKRLAILDQDDESA